VRCNGCILALEAIRSRFNSYHPDVPLVQRLSSLAGIEASSALDHSRELAELVDALRCYRSPWGFETLIPCLQAAIAHTYTRRVILYTRTRAVRTRTRADAHTRAVLP
jgi:hypothetical protein